ncbi:hypothetical protein A1O1_00864 [Capronia coronata CBS 617.96]|uniref:Uncharacterized protein n=1 Tax=Capronia coronata CBS 617.96 TaxID=1182541 RepID=W9Z1A2_9EURO|nr:uncharacterized protein A1O1_00864 [Capronia coronata CBS 617.96]EXJ95740.1 hypothetical protein A1O1_00864 [Capronia coronata CBS 617.96]
MDNAPAQKVILAVLTPAPTRRFLPPSSSGATSSIRSSNQRNVFQPSRSTQPVAASPFGATPRFHLGIRGEKDDIQTTFDDDDDDDTSVLPKGRVGAHAQDAIEVEHDELERTSPLLHRNRFITPVVKRRKVSHPEVGPVRTITISSSPEVDDLSQDDAYDDMGIPASESELEDNIDLASKTPETNESNRAIRFRGTTTAMADATPLSRTVFKSASDGFQPTPATSAPVLPDVFSPSRRKGKGDYVSGGSADLVRNWVLHVAAQESQAATNPELTINVRKVVKDKSGRFVIVVDENASQWLLPEQHQKGFTTLRTTWPELHTGSRILLKGKATRWPLQLDNTFGDVCVAAYWELISNG